MEKRALVLVEEKRTPIVIAERKVLVLNMYYQPERIVDWQRAVCLIYDGKADLIERYEGELLRSPSMSMEFPSVIRKTKKSRMRKVSIKFSRQNVLLRDGNTCQYCQVPFEPRELNYDHVLPRSRKGKTEWDNIVMSCYPCNEKKGDRTPAEAKMQLKRAPRKPDWLPIVSKRFDLGAVPETWRPYLVAA
jgi:5-methylcytosine-specific restriction endonuclease McrA